MRFWLFSTQSKDKSSACCKGNDKHTGDAAQGACMALLDNIRRARTSAHNLLHTASHIRAAVRLPCPRDIRAHGTVVNDLTGLVEPK